MARRLVRAVRSRQGAAHVCRGGLRRAAQARVESAALLAAARASRWRRSVVRDGTSFARARARARSVLDVRRCEATDTKAGRGSRLGGGLDRPAWLMASKGGQQARAMAHAGGGGGVERRETGGSALAAPAATTRRRWRGRELWGVRECPERRRALSTTNDRELDERSRARERRVESTRRGHTSVESARRARDREVASAARARARARRRRCRAGAV